MTDPLIALLLGWFLGIAGALIASRVQHAHHLKESSRSIIAELKELRFQFAITLFRIGCRLGNLSKDQLQSISGILRDYKGPLSDPRITKALKETSQMCEKQFPEWLKQFQDPDTTIGLIKFNAFSLESQIAVLGAFPYEFQYRAFNLLRVIRAINEHVDESRNYHHKTFDPDLDANNRQILEKNLNMISLTVYEQAEIALELIGGLLEQERKLSLSIFLARGV